jgi:diguanylate cyclase (GGDEF)-like protein
VHSLNLAHPNVTQDRSPATTPSPSAPDRATEAEPAVGSAEQALAQGHAWLRFPPALEARFKADTLEPRRKLLLTTGLVGIVSICLGSVKLAELMPDIVALASRNLALILAVCILAVASFWMLPPRRRRTWQAELATAIPLLAVNVGLIYGCMISRADTTFTHAAALVSAVMYACIVARLRFAWSLGCALLTFVGYIALARPRTPLQELVVDATTTLMAVSYVFALVANYAFEHSERRNWLLRQFAAEQHEALTQASVRLHRLSVQDALTGLFNRRQFDADLAQAWTQAQATHAPLAMLSIDVDFFKRYNDAHGHPAGDACLQRVAQALSEVALAQGGVAARLGGEEFGLLLPGCTLDKAVAAGEAVCEAVKQAQVAHRSSPVSDQVSVSVGAAQLWPAAGGNPALLVDLADQALYRAKEGGRQRVCAAPDSPPDGSAPGEAGQPEQADAPLGTPSAPAESLFTRILQGGFRRLRFPPEQEKAFREHNAQERHHRLELMAVLGLVIHNVYALVSRPMFPDIEHTALLWQVGLSALMLLMTAFSRVTPMSVQRREAVYSLGTSVLAVMSAWVLSQSHELTALAHVVSLVLIPMFAGVGARQPFRFTCVPSVVTCAALVLLLHPVGAQQELVFADSLLMVFTNTMFTLILAYTLEHGTRKEWLLSQIERQQGDALQAATQRLHGLSMLDPLTGICNRRQFEADFQRIWADSEPDHRPLAMLMIDVDFFKHYNDAHGHPAGDRCLKQVAQALSKAAWQAHGLVARLGGEEFVILLPGADIHQAERVGEAVCEAVRQAGIPHGHTQVPGLATLSVSVGATSLVARKGTAPRSVFALADQALYIAKNGGRNRVATLGPNDQPLPRPLMAPQARSQALAD